MNAEKAKMLIEAEGYRVISLESDKDSSYSFWCEVENGTKTLVVWTSRGIIVAPT